MKATYDSLKAGIEDLENAVMNNVPKINTEISTEFINLNEDFVPEDTKDTKRSIPLNSNYKTGEIIAKTPYVPYIYYGDMEFTKPGAEHEWFEHTAKTYKDDLADFTEDVVAKYIDKQ